MTLPAEILTLNNSNREIPIEKTIIISFPIMKSVITSRQFHKLR